MSLICGVYIRRDPRNHDHVLKYPTQIDFFAPPRICVPRISDLAGVVEVFSGGGRFEARSCRCVAHTAPRARAAPPATPLHKRYGRGASSLAAPSVRLAALIASYTAFTLGPMAISAVTALRLSAELSSRVDRVSEELCRRAAGLPCSRSAALRLLVTRGLDVVERELGLATAKKRGNRG